MVTRENAKGRRIVRQRRKREVWEKQRAEKENEVKDSEEQDMSRVTGDKKKV